MISFYKYEVKDEMISVITSNCETQFDHWYN